jgi:hypothetical protein
MRVSSLVTSASPLYFNTYAEEDELLKTKMNENYISREINISNNGKKIFVNLGEIEINGEKIGFYNIDSLGKKGMFNNKEKSNLLISESFEINKETEIYFSIGMLSQKSLSSDVNSNRDIKAKVVLINDENNQIVGTIKTFRMNDKSNPADKLNRYRFNNESGITMKAKLGLIVEGVEESEINVTNLISSA